MKGANRGSGSEPASPRVSTFVPRDAAEGRTETKTQRTSDTLSDTLSVTSVHRPPPPRPAAAKGYAWFASGSSSSCGGRETPAPRARRPPGRRCAPRERSRWERRSCRRSERQPRRSSFARRGYESTRRRRRRRRRRAVPRSAQTRSPRRTRRGPPIGGRRWRPPSASTASTATPGRGSGRTPASAPSRSGARAPRPATSPSATSSRPITIRRSRPKSRAFAPISRARPRPPRRRCGPRRAPRLSSDACPSRFTGRGCARARGGWRWRRATPGTSSPRRRRLRFVGTSIRRRVCGWTTRMNRRARVQAPATGPKPRPPPRRSRGSRCPPTARGRPSAPGVWEPPPPSRWERAPRDPPRSSWTGGAGASAGRAC